MLQTLHLPDGLKKQLRRAGWGCEETPDNYLSRLLREPLEIASKEDAVLWRALAKKALSHTSMSEDERRHVIVFHNMTWRMI
jgi:hypothetical protein